jgi:hypothetical protein
MASRSPTSNEQEIPLETDCRTISCHHRIEGDKMRKSQNLPIDRAATLLVAVGGEPVAGSGFEAEEPEPDFATDERSEDEVRHTPPE